MCGLVYPVISWILGDCLQKIGKDWKIFGSNLLIFIGVLRRIKILLMLALCSLWTYGYKLRAKGSKIIDRTTKLCSYFWKLGLANASSIKIVGGGVQILNSEHDYELVR